MTTSSIIRVIIFDTNHFVQMGFSKIIDQESDIQIVAYIESLTSAYDTFKQVSYDMALVNMDQMTKDNHGLLYQLLNRQARVLIVAYSMYVHNDQDQLLDMFKLGISGYVTLEDHPEHILQIMRGVARKEGPLVSSSVAVRHMQHKINGNLLESAMVSAREIQILKLVALGYTNQYIANILSISIGTVKNHISNIYAKIQVHSRAEMVAWAYRNIHIENDPIGTSIDLPLGDNNL